MVFTMSKTFEGIYRYIPRYGPEWGSGGIFGLKYHKRVLYFTLAFEAKAYFLSDEKERLYNFSLVGDPPCSGGDTYNAVTAVDEKIYFGGWVHVKTNEVYSGRKLRFVNKYSHIHAYDIELDKVDLLWKEGSGSEDTWVGEVSELIYDELNNQLFVARGDGHEKLGLFSFDLEKQRMRQLSEEPALKGSILMDYAIFTKGGIFFDGLQIVDIDKGNKCNMIEVEELSNGSRDGQPFDNVVRVVGNTGTTANRFFIFLQGGLLVGNPVEYEESRSKMSFVRLFDFVKSSYSPFRVNTLPIRGGLLTAYNTLPDMLGRRDPALIAPSVLIFISPPIAKIVGVFGTRVTSIEKAGSKILVAANTMPNTGEPIAIDNGYRDIAILSDEILDNTPPPFYLSTNGAIVEDDVWGGIPLTGYKERKLILRLTKTNELSIFEYDVLNPDPVDYVEEKEYLTEGKNIIDLSGYAGIVSFKLKNIDPKAKIKIELM